MQGVEFLYQLMIKSEGVSTARATVKRDVETVTRPRTRANPCRRGSGGGEKTDETQDRREAGGGRGRFSCVFGQTGAGERVRLNVCGSVCVVMKSSRLHGNHQVE